MIIENEINRFGGGSIVTGVDVDVGAIRLTVVEKAGDLTIKGIGSIIA